MNFTFIILNKNPTFKYEFSDWAKADASSKLPLRKPAQEGLVDHLPQKCPAWHFHVTTRHVPRYISLNSRTSSHSCLEQTSPCRQYRSFRIASDEAIQNSTSFNPSGCKTCTFLSSSYLIYHRQYLYLFHLHLLFHFHFQHQHHTPHFLLMYDVIH